MSNNVNPNYVHGGELSLDVITDKLMPFCNGCKSHDLYIATYDGCVPRVVCSHINLCEDLFGRMDEEKGKKND